MEKFVEKFPFKKMLYMNWYEAAIAHLLLFKHLKDKFAGKVYFLISDQGILLKAASSPLLASTEDEINKFFTARIEQLELSGSADFYEHVIDEIKEQTKIRDNRDCPFVNLVSSDKLKHCCLAMKKFGYAKPYENWESHERERRGFCFLIVRPENRWKEIASIVTNIAKRFELRAQKTPVEPVWPAEISYEKFIWLFLRKEFLQLKKSMDIKENKTETVLSLAVRKQQAEFVDMERVIGSLQVVYCHHRPAVQSADLVMLLSSLQVEKITELIYHEFGLPSLVRELRKKTSGYLLVCPEETVWEEQEERGSGCCGLEMREDMSRLSMGSVSSVFRLGRRHDIVSVEGMKFVLVRFGNPLSVNVENCLKVRLPCLPRYFYWSDSPAEVCMLRKYEPHKLKASLEKESFYEQVFLMNSLILIVKHLHIRSIHVGAKFANNVFVDGKKIILEPAETGSVAEDLGKLTLYVREWVKGLRECAVKSLLEQLSETFEMQAVLQEYLDKNE